MSLKYSPLKRIYCFVSIWSMICVLLMTVSILLSGCELMKPAKTTTISGINLEWERPFILRMMQKNGKEFSGILKWTSEHSWTYIEGRFIGKDSLIFNELDHVLGGGTALNASYPGKITGDSIIGKWNHKTYKSSGKSYFARINYNSEPISDIEKNVWDRYHREKKIKANVEEAKKELLTIWKKVGKKVSNAKIDSLQKIGARDAMSLFDAAYQFYQEYSDTLNSNIALKEAGIRFSKYLAFFSLTDEQLTKLETFLENQQPEGSPFHYRLHRLLQDHHDKKLFESEVLSQDEKNKIHQKQQKELLTQFWDKPLHPHEMPIFLTDFIYKIYKNDSSYKTRLLEKIAQFQKKAPDQQEKFVDLERRIITIDNSKKLLPGALAPDFTSRELSGKKIQLSSFRGKVVVLEFWASWCRPCVEAAPTLKKLYKTFKAKNFAMLGVAMEDSLAAQTYCNKENISWTILLEDKGWESQVAALYGITGIPTLFIIDQKGKIVDRTHPGNPRLTENIGKLF